MDYYSRCLVREVELLQRCEVQFKLKAKPIVDQLTADADRPLPDQLPLPPLWTTFEWPRGGEVDFRTYWRDMDRHSNWLGEHL